MATNKSIVFWEHLQAAITDLWSRMSTALARKVNSSTYIAGMNGKADVEHKHAIADTNGLQDALDALANASTDTPTKEVVSVENEAALYNLEEPQAEVIYVTLDENRLFIYDEDSGEFSEVTNQTVDNTIYVSDLDELANRTYTETGLYTVLHTYIKRGIRIGIATTKCDVYTLSVQSSKARQRPGVVSYIPTLTSKDGWAEKQYDSNTDEYTWLWHKYAYTESGSYEELKDLAESGSLKAGSWYRMTDFVTTCANDEEARSAGHAYDLLLLAVSASEFSHQARAVAHAGDTYFANANLGAWKLLYDINNDIRKHVWADEENGKGVVYRMVDEYDNDFPYDFKNIQFKRYLASSDESSIDGQYYAYNGEMNGVEIADESDYRWAYTLTLENEDGDWVDYSVQGELLANNGTDWGYLNQTKKGRCEGNHLRHTYTVITIDDDCYRSATLNNIVLISSISEENGMQNEMIDNVFGYGNYNMTLKDNPEANHFGNKCYNNVVGSYDNTFGQGCHDMTFGQGCGSLTFGQYCSWLTFGQNVNNLVFDAGVQYIQVLNDDPNTQIKNAHIFSGVHGTSDSNKLTLSLTPNADYTQFVAMKSDGTVRIWNPADVA